MTKKLRKFLLSGYLAQVKLIASGDLKWVSALSKMYRKRYKVKARNIEQQLIKASKELRMELWGEI